VGRMVEDRGCCRGIVHLQSGDGLLLAREHGLRVDRLGVPCLAIERGLHRCWCVLNHDDGLSPPHAITHIGLVASDDECDEVQDAIRGC